MRQFLSTYFSLLIILPLIFIAGNIIPALGIAVGTIVGLIFLVNGNKGQLIFLYLAVLVLADSREEMLLFFKDLRVSLVFAMSIWVLAELSRNKVPWKQPFFWILPFFVSALFSLVLFSPTKFYSLQKTVSYLLVVFVTYHLIVPWIIEKRRHFEELIHFIGLLLILGLIKAVFTPETTFLGNRYMGVFANPNGIGLACMVWAPLLFAAYKTHRSNGHWRTYGLLLLVSLIMSQSRNSLGGVIIFFGLMWALGVRKRRNIIFLIIPILYLIIVSVDWIALGQSLGLGEYLRLEGIETASGRTLSWAYAATLIPEGLWLGKGFGYDEYAYHVIIPESLDHLRQMSSTWNSYLTLLLNTGVIGLSMFILFVGAQIGYGVHKWKTAAFVIAMLLGAIFETWLTASLNAFTIYFYLFLGYLAYKDPF